MAVVVLEAAVLAAIESQGDGARPTGVRPASLQAVEPLAPTATVQERANGPAAETTTTTAAPVTSPVVTVTEP